MTEWQQTFSRKHHIYTSAIVMFPRHLLWLPFALGCWDRWIFSLAQSTSTWSEGNRSLTDANIFQALLSLDLNTKAVHKSCLWVLSGSMWQDKYDLLDSEGGGLVPWNNKHNKCGFPESQRVGILCQRHKDKLTAVPWSQRSHSWLSPE